MTSDTSAFSPFAADPRTSEPLPESVSLDAQRSTLSLLRFVRSIDVYRRRLAVDAQLGLTEMRALSRLAEAAHLTPKELGDSLGLTTGSVTALADRLDSAGLVARVANPRDRRSVKLELTPVGREKIEAIHRTFQMRVLATVRTMPPELVETVNDFLASVSAEFESEYADVPVLAEL